MVQKTMLEILDETAKFYNTGNRSISLGGINNCLYQGPDGKRCAFGRCVEEDTLEFITEGNSIDEDMLKYLKLEYQGHGIMFWSTIQSFHDAADYWNESGLTERGIGDYERIASNIKKGVFL